MGIVDRVRNILLTPKTEWPVIAGESPSTGDLMGGYVAPLAGISVLCHFVGSSIVGTSLPFLGTYRMPIVAGIGIAVFSFVMAYGIGWIIQKTIGFRINNEDEVAGVDTIVHGEEGYALDAV